MVGLEADADRRPSHDDGPSPSMRAIKSPLDPRQLSVQVSRPTEARPRRRGGKMAPQALRHETETATTLTQNAHAVGSHRPRPSTTTGGRRPPSGGEGACLTASQRDQPSAPAADSGLTLGLSLSLPALRRGLDQVLPVTRRVPPWVDHVKSVVRADRCDPSQTLAIGHIQFFHDTRHGREDAAHRERQPVHSPVPVRVPDAVQAGTPDRVSLLGVVGWLASFLRMTL